MRKVIAFSILPILLILLSINTYAASLSLTHIGALATGGSNYTEWWYTGLNPTLKGTAANGATVKVSIEGTENSTTADSSGNWSLATTMSQGDYPVSITSSGESLNLTLHIGQYVPNTTGTTLETTQSTIPVPDTGSNQTPIIIMSFGLYTLAAYYFMFGRQNALKAFEKKITK